MIARVLLIAVIFTLCAVTGYSNDPINLRFVNDNPEFSDSDVYVMLRKGTTNVFAASYSGIPIVLTTSYSFSQLSGGVVLSNIVAGEFYVSLGKPMTVPVTNAAGNLPGELDQSALHQAPIHTDDCRLCC